MFEKKLFLSHKEAQQAIISDLNTYEYQPEAWKDIHSEILKITELPGFISDIQHLSRALSDIWEQEDRKPQLLNLTRLCGILFETHTEPGTDPESGIQGIWLDTGMKNFSCKQCGTCCLPGFQWTCSDQDIIRWKHSDRPDILKRVGFRQTTTKKEPYLWINPETGMKTDYCPWLHQKRASQKHICLIHDLKPDVCRDYPYTRKHARMYRCRGFDPA